MRISLVTRLKKLEIAKRRQGTNRVLTYDPMQPEGKRNALRSVGKPGRYLLIPNFGTEWETGVYAQQRRLIEQANTRK